MPRQPFFLGSELAMVKEPVSKIADCHSCGLYKDCRTPKMPVYGKGRMKIMIIGEVPGKEEDDRGRPFVGKAGQRLRKELNKHGIDLDTDCWSTNSLICYPTNTNPDSKNVEYCRPNVLNAIETYNPQVIILVGYWPVKSVIGHYWKDDIGDALARWVGWQIPFQKTNTWICPTYHPSYIERMEDPTLDMFFSTHIKNAARLIGRPWKVVPDYKSKIHILTSPEQAVEEIHKYIKENKAVGVDYETTCLKPDGPHAKIISCAIGHNEKCHAFLWHPKVMEAMREFWLSPVPKIASNLVMEDLWTRRFFGIEVKNWCWDTALGAHVIDNRSEITSLKFQSFVELGVELWNQHIDPFLKAKDEGCGNSPNRIHEVRWEDLLLYNGMDSILEYELAAIQAKKLKLFLE